MWLNLDPAIPDYKGLTRWDIMDSLVRRLCEKIWPSANLDETVIQNIGAGNFNDVIGININGHNPSATYQAANILKHSIYPHVDISDEDNESAQGKFVLRVPKQKDRIEKSAVALKYLGKHAPFPVPRVIHCDITSCNPILLPYILMDWVEGLPLSDIFQNNGLDDSQRLNLAKELALFYRQMQGMNSDTSGEIFPHSVEKIDSGTIALQPIGSHPFERDPAILSIWTNGKSSDQASLGMLIEAYQRKLREAQEGKTSPLHKFVPQLKTCLDIARGMYGAGMAAEEAKHCLIHTDLFPRNIMIDPSKTPMITSIIDWDEAIFAPKFATCQPPVWLWQDVGRQKDEVEKFGPDWSAADSPAHVQIKTTFEEAMDSDYATLAYDPRYVIARRLLKFARDPTWQWRDWYIDQVDEMSREWGKILAKTT